MLEMLRYVRLLKARIKGDYGRIKSENGTDSRERKPGRRVMLVSRLMEWWKQKWEVGQSCGTSSH